MSLANFQKKLFVINYFNLRFFFGCVERSEKRELLHIHSQIYYRNI